MKISPIVVLRLETEKNNAEYEKDSIEQDLIHGRIIPEEHKKRLGELKDRVQDSMIHILNNQF